MVIEVAPAKKSGEVKDDQAYDLPGYTSAGLEATAPSPNLVRVRSCKKYRGHGCCCFSGFIILILIGVTIYLGIQVARLRKRERYEKPHFYGNDALFPDDDGPMDAGKPSDPDFDLDFDKIPDEAWTTISEGIKSCIIPKDTVQAEEDVVEEVGPNGEILGGEDDIDVDITENFDVDGSCLSKLMKEKKMEIKHFLKGCKRPHGNHRPGRPGRPGRPEHMDGEW